MEGQSIPHVGPLHGQYDRRGQQVSGNRAEDNLELPASFPREQLGQDRWEWTNKRVGVVVGVVALLSTLCSAALVALAAQGWRAQSPAEVTRAQDAKIDATTRAIGRLVPFVEAGARYTCSKDLSGAKQAGYPCGPLLDGRGILTPQRHAAPADGSFTSNPMSSVANLGGVR